MPDKIRSWVRILRVLIIRFFSEFSFFKMRLSISQSKVVNINSANRGQNLPTFLFFCLKTTLRLHRHQIILFHLISNIRPRSNARLIKWKASTSDVNPGCNQIDSRDDSNEMEKCRNVIWNFRSINPDRITEKSPFSLRRTVFSGWNRKMEISTFRIMEAPAHSTHSHDIAFRFKVYAWDSLRLTTLTRHKSINPCREISSCCVGA